jgi:hypothetical protein
LGKMSRFIPLLAREDLFPPIRLSKNPFLAKQVIVPPLLCFKRFLSTIHFYEK